MRWSYYRASMILGTRSRLVWGSCWCFRFSNLALFFRRGRNCFRLCLLPWLRCFRWLSHVLESDGYPSFAENLPIHLINGSLSFSSSRDINQCGAALDLPRCDDIDQLNRVVAKELTQVSFGNCRRKPENTKSPAFFGG